MPLPNSEALAPREQATPKSELDRILQSRAFEKTPTLKKLLTYLWDHRDEDLNEYAIATEALGRKPDFEPRLDATVRVLVSRLRQRLKEFYEVEGAHFSTRIVIPLGTHQVQVIRMEAEPPTITLDLVHAGAVAETAPDAAKSPSLLKTLLRRLLWLQFAIILVLVATNLWTLRSRARENPVNKIEQLPGFWREFFGNGKETHILVPNPAFFTYQNGLMARDKRVNEFGKRGDSAPLKVLEQAFGPPQLALNYIASTDTFAALRLEKYLDPQGSQIQFSTTGEISPADMDHENIILIGNPHTLSPLHDLVDQLSLIVDVDSRSVTDRRAGPGVPLKFETVEQSGTRMTTPGVIACLPGGPSGTHVMILMTTYFTSALVNYITSEAGLKELRSAQAAHGNSQYFEAVILTEVDGTTPLSGKLALFRPFKPQS